MKTGILTLLLFLLLFISSNTLCNAWLFSKPSRSFMERLVPDLYDYTKELSIWQDMWIGFFSCFTGNPFERPKSTATGWDWLSFSSKKPVVEPSLSKEVGELRPKSRSPVFPTGILSMFQSGGSTQKRPSVILLFLYYLGADGLFKSVADSSMFLLIDCVVSIAILLLTAFFSIFVYLWLPLLKFFFVLGCILLLYMVSVKVLPVVFLRRLILLFFRCGMLILTSIHVFIYVIDNMNMNDVKKDSSTIVSFLKMVPRFLPVQ